MGENAAIRAAQVHAAYDVVEVLHGISLSLPWGAVTAIAGPNGAGKSALLETLAGVREPTSGTIFRSASPALVVQTPGVSDALPLTVTDVVRIGAARPGSRNRSGERRPGGGFHRRGRREVAAATAAALRAVQLSALAARPFTELSGGQRQRVLVAQGIATGASILLLDEPAAGLDAASRKRLRAILAAEAARGTAVVCVTHDPEDLAEADRVVWLEAGLIAPRSAPLQGSVASTPPLASSTPSVTLSAQRR